MRASRSIVAASLGVVLAWPTIAVASVPGASASVLAAYGPALERRGRLDVDASALGESQTLVSEKIHETSALAFQSAGVTASDAPDDPVLKLVIVPLEGDTAGYRITWHVERKGEKVAGSEGVSDCRLCTEGELVDAAVAGIELAVDKMEVAVEPEPEPETDPLATDPTQPSGDGSTPGEPDRGDRKLGPMGYAGIALTIVGAAGLGTGIGLAVRKPKPSDSMPTKLLDTRNPGYGAIAAGAAVAITGVVLIVLDLRRSRSSGAAARRAPPRRTVMAPWLGPDGGGGMTLHHRF